MAGTMTITYDDGQDGAGFRGRIRKIVADWTSDAADGTCSGTTRKISGRLIKAVTDPGSVAPTDDYDISITDEEGSDVLSPCQNTLANRDSTSTEQVYFLVKDTAGTPLAQSLHPAVCDQLTISISNAGNSKTGQLIMYYEV